MDEITKDSRFSHIVKDPRFKKLPKKHVKVKIDKRFQSMFREKKFQIKYNVDKRGRKVKLGGSEDLKRYYELSDDDSECDDDDNENEKNGKEKLDENSSSEKELDDHKDENVLKTCKKDRKTITPEVKKKLKDLTIDYARGEGAIFSDSSSDEESSNPEEDGFEFIHDWGELDKDAETTENATKRLAVCNMNWDRIEAVDLMVLFNSFLPPGGLINSITIYPSEFGLQRMKEEDEKGPIELTEKAPEGEENEIIQTEKLRKYQLNRLKYYYAIIDCDTPETADGLYKECDGLEYESSSNKLDLRFVPDDTVFDQEPRDTCTSIPDLSIYKPKLFMTSALTKAKCDLTWDETDPNRENIVKSIHCGNIEETHLKKYLACSSSSEDSENETTNEPIIKENMKSLGAVEKYKALLVELENKQKNSKKNEINLEVSWNLRLENKASQMVKEASKEKEKKTPFQQYLEKRKEKKKKKQEQRKAQQNEEGKEEEEENAFSDDEIPSDVDMNDPYFKEEFESVKTVKSTKKKKPKNESEDEESKRKKGELELLMLDNEPENLRHFSLKSIEESEKFSKKKKLKGKKRKLEDIKAFKDDFKIDVNDERFSALYTSHHFNIDPADPQFKPTKATKELMEEKSRRRELENEDVPSKKLKSQEMLKSKPENSEWSALVKNIKKNTLEVWKNTGLK